MVAKRIFRLLHGTRIGHDPHDLRAENLWFIENVERIAVAFRHLFAVGAGDARGAMKHLGLGQDKRFAEVMIKTGRQVAANLDMLHLILAHGHGVGIVGEDVGRHATRDR